MTQFDESFREQQVEEQITDISTQLVSVRIDKDLIAELDTFKEKGICKSRAETMNMILSAGLKVLEPKIEDMEKAVQVLNEIKQKSST